MDSKTSVTDRFDWALAFIIFLFFVISLLAISSAQTSGQYGLNFIPKQVLWYGVGAAIIAGAMFFDIDQYKRMAWYLYGFGIFLLIVLMIAPGGQGQLAEIRNGAKSWFHTPVGSIQPSEFMKTFFILAMAKVISSHNEQHLIKTVKTDFLLLGKIALVAGLPLAFILKQPDLGSALVFIAITVALIVVGGVSWKILVPVLGAGSVLGVTLIWMALNMQQFMADYLGVEPYKFGRIYSWLDPESYASDEGYQLLNSLKAIGSGEIFGKGFHGRVVYIPEQHTDAIFTVIGEEYGFIGASLVISLYFLLIYHLTKITLELKDQFSTYVCAGIIAMITFHVFENIGMWLQLLPITGIPLPFISYGGSSLMGNFLAIALVFSMKFHHRKYMFSSEDDE